MFEYPYIIACNKILLKILSEKNVNEDIIDSLNQHIKYIPEDEVLETLLKVNMAFEKYKEHAYDINTFLKKVEEIYAEYQDFLLNERPEDNVSL